MNNTYLPVFNGFYETIFQYDDDQQIEYINELRKEKKLSDIEYEHLDINIKEYENDISKKLCEVLEKKLKKFVEKIVFENVYNPKEYNFKTDSINCIIYPKIDNIKEFIYKHQKEFKEYLKANYTSRDGFISGYSDSFEGWKEETKDFTCYDANGHFLGSILSFICEVLEIDNLNLYYELVENFDYSNYINNFEELAECLIYP